MCLGPFFKPFNLTLPSPVSPPSSLASGMEVALYGLMIELTDYYPSTTAPTKEMFSFAEELSEKCRLANEGDLPDPITSAHLTTDDR